MMSKQYDRAKIFKMVSESYELGLTAAEYCCQKNFPSKIFYRYRQQYVETYGAKPMPEPKMKLYKAIEYIENRWQKLIRYLWHGEVQIDNNLVENAFVLRH